MSTMDRTQPRTNGLLGTCLRCSLSLPLRLPEVGETSREWACAGCGATYQGVLLEDWPAEFQANVRPVPSASEPGESLTPWLQPAPRDPISIALPDRVGIRCELETSLSRQFDAVIGRGTNLRLPPQGEPFAARVRDHGGRLYDKDVLNRLAQVVNRSSEQLAEVFGALQMGGHAGMHVVESISQDGLFRAAEDIDLFVYLGITPSSDRYPSRHSLRVAMLATAMAVWQPKLWKDALSMTFLPSFSVNFSHIRSMSPQSGLPTVPTESASAISPMLLGLAMAS